jgi:hypothetical protein
MAAFSAYFDFGGEAQGKARKVVEKMQQLAG